MKNALQIHGTPKHSPNHRYLTYADGTPFFWLADTWWYAGTSRMTKPILHTLLRNRRKKGFTVILLVVGAPPEVDPRSSQAANEGGTAFQKDGSLNSAYFDEINTVIRATLDAGLVPCLVGSWGHHIDRLGVEAMKYLWDEIITRWGRLPVIFCLTGEADGFLQETITSRILRPNTALAARLAKWQEVARYIKQKDTNNHLLTVHPQRKRLASELFPDPSWLDIDTIQSGHTRENAGFLVSAALAAHHRLRPFINIEPWYEGIMGNFGPSYQRFAFWMSILAGAKGYTYGAHGIWQLAKGDNFMSHWGKSDWHTAVKYKGSTQVGLAKKFLDAYPWWTMQPSLDIIQPSWNTSHPFSPLAAKDREQRIWIYVPIAKKTSTYSIHIPNHRLPVSIRWIHPSTMRIIKKQGFKKFHSFTSSTKEDCLILLEPAV